MSMPSLGTARYDRPRGSDLAALEYEQPGIRPLRVDALRDHLGADEEIDTRLVADPGALPVVVMLQTDGTVLRALVDKYLATAPPPVLTAEETAIYDALVDLGL